MPWVIQKLIGYMITQKAVNPIFNQMSSRSIGFLPFIFIFQRYRLVFLFYHIYAEKAREAVYYLRKR